MKRKNLFVLALAVLAASVSVVANAYGIDTHAFVLQHADAFAGLSMLCMGNMELITKSIEDSNKLFEDFKKANDEKLAKLEKGLAHSDELARSTAIFADLSKTQEEIKKSLEDIQAKAKRPGFGGNANDADETTAEHKKAFRGYMAKGNDTGLAALEQKALAISTNAGADGGYAVPKVIDSMMESLVVNISPIRSIANVVQVSTNDYHKLVNLKGSASAVATETGARAATATPTLADITINAYDMYANPQATQQMLDDVFFNAEAWLADELAEEFGRQEGALFVAGSGSNQPKGLLTATMAATADATRAFGTVEYVPTGVSAAFPASSPSDILITLVSKVKARYRANASFVMPKSVLFTIAAFKDTSGRYIFNPITAPNVPATLLGYPVIEAEDVPVVAASSYSVLFGDFKRAYTIVDRIGTRVIRDPFSNKPYIGFYTTKRVGGSVINSEAYKTLKFSVS
jgi:HK97 family phage major capsid protein